jgi:glyoxylase-like metal-dependent hydrolase (beta-lactamase superfamily II)
MDRRKFLGVTAAVLAGQQLTRPSLNALVSQAAIKESSPVLDPWRPGFLEIHHIATNRGNSAFFILPDGTTMMVDAGALYGSTPYLTAQKPSAERRPGEWIGRYVQRRLKSANLSGTSPAIDTFMLTHIHADHVGGIPPGSAPNAEGYIPTGVSDVAASVPIRRIVDRAWPDYAYPLPASADFQQNYRNFLLAGQKSGLKVERFRPGTRDQFKLLHKPGDYPTFEIRNLAVNGEVWTGEAEKTTSRFPDLATLKPADYPSENCCSAAIRLRYGKFAYYTGGDLPSDSNYGRDPWRDIETPVAQVCGPVSVAVANHHGYFNADGPEYVRALRPQVFVIPAWDSAHPTVNVLNQMFSKAIYPGPRDVFATLINAENRIANKKTDDLRSRAGHIVVRVDPGGATFRVHILSNDDETDRVTASFGPYTA